MSFTLTEGALARICAHLDSQNAVVQVLGHKGITVSNECLNIISRDGFKRISCFHPLVSFACPTLLGGCSCILDLMHSSLTGW